MGFPKVQLRSTTQYSEVLPTARRGFSLYSIKTYTYPPLEDRFQVEGQSVQIGWLT